MQEVESTSAEEFALYLDTSALVKLYVEEDYSEVVEEAAAAATALYTSALADLEARVSLARIRHDGRIETEEDLDRALSALQEDLAGNLLEVVDDGRRLARRAGDLARKHARIRSYDALHMASALEAFEGVSEKAYFLAFDRAFVRAARKELDLYFDPYPEQAEEAR